MLSLVRREKKERKKEKNKLQIATEAQRKVRSRKYEICREKLDADSRRLFMNRITKEYKLIKYCIKISINHNFSVSISVEY